MTELFRQRALFLGLHLQIAVLPVFYLQVLQDWLPELCQWLQGICFRLISGGYRKRSTCPGKRELETDYQGEVRELTSLYMQRGLEPELARQVAEQLMVKDALDAHAREELGLTDINSAQPLQAAVFSALSFSAGAVLPLIVAWLSPLKLAFLLIILSTLFSLAVLGYISSVLSKASPVRAIIRITFWSTMAMLLSMGIGHFAGQALL
jgi:VIT1/CCC1 family predicted Fe2+/Mn2+ transporter